jgi:hypothetical protein
MIYFGTRIRREGQEVHVWICKSCKSEILTVNKTEPYCLNSKCIKNIDTNNN